MIRRHAGEYGISTMCSFYGVSRSGYYDWAKRDLSGGRDEEIRDLILECQRKNKWRYGYRRVRLWLLREHGLKLNHKAVQRVMMKYCLHARIRQKRFRTYTRNENLKHENVLNRDFSTEHACQKWATDITYIKTPEGTLYLSAVEDLHGNMIVGYQMAEHQDYSLVDRTVKAASAFTGSTAGLILHSDQGCQYTSYDYNNLIKTLGIVPSMSCPGSPYDNACIENFFSILKTECLYREKPQTIVEAIALVEEFIEYYNYERIQLRTGLTPFEMYSMAI